MFESLRTRKVNSIIQSESQGLSLGTTGISTGVWRPKNLEFQCPRGGEVYITAQIKRENLPSFQLFVLIRALNRLDYPATLGRVDLLYPGYDLNAIISWKNSVLVHSGCYKTITTKWAAYKQQIFIPHSARGWRVQDHGTSVFHVWLVIHCWKQRKLSFHGVLTW